MDKFRVIIAGSRNFSDYEFLVDKCNTCLKNKIDNYEIVIISGTAKGADLLGEVYAKEYEFRIERYKPLWDIYGKGAGFVRNKEMAEVADAGILFDLGTRGTAHMASLLKEKKIPYRHFKINE